MSEPSQRSTVSQTVPRTVALLYRAVVRNLPLDCPQRRATTFFSDGFLLAESARRAVERQAAATFATRVSSVAAPRARACRSRNCPAEKTPRPLVVVSSILPPRTSTRAPIGIRRRSAERPSVHQHRAADRTGDGVDALHRNRRGRCGRGNRGRTACDGDHGGADVVRLVRVRPRSPTRPPRRRVAGRAHERDERDRRGCVGRQRAELAPDRRRPGARAGARRDGDELEAVPSAAVTTTAVAGRARRSARRSCT